MNKLIAYTYSALSFIIPKIGEGFVKSIILFGSVVRGESTKESDIDLFIEIYDEANTNSVENNIDSGLKQFYKSSTYDEWKLRGVNNEIKCLIGSLKKQSDLKRSIISNGLMLYGKYSEPIKGLNYVLFSFKTISEKNKRYKVFRRLFGRREKEKTTKGLVKELGGEQISNRVFIIPIEQAPIILKLLRKEKVNYSMREISAD